MTLPTREVDATLLAAAGLDVPVVVVPQGCDPRVRDRSGGAAAVVVAATCTERKADEIQAGDLKNAAYQRSE